MKIYEKIKEINIFPIFSFSLTIISYLIAFLDKRCGNGPANLSFLSALLGALALIYVIIRKRRGKLLAVLSILFGLLGSLVLITFC